MFSGRSAERQARIREAVSCEIIFGRTFRPDKSKLDGDALAFDGVIALDLLSVTDDGRAERVGFQSREPDIAGQ